VKATRWAGKTGHHGCAIAAQRGTAFQFIFGNVGDSGDQFTVEVHHGGFFVGEGNLRTYVNEKVDFFDYLEAETWSLLWFDDFVQQLGYPKD
jgi:hypothetical protein